MIRQTEGQPQPIRPFKKGVDFTARGKPQESTLSWVNNPFLTPADRQEIQAYGRRLDLLVEVDRQRRAQEPKPPTHIEVDGIKYTGLEYFLHLLTESERREQEAAARGEVYIPSFSANQKFGLDVAPEPASLTYEQQIQRDGPIVRRLRVHMAKEAENMQFDQAAEIIQKKVWKDSQPVTIAPLEKFQVTVKKDGSTVNRSFFGTTLSYTHEDMAWSERKEKVVRMPQREELSFGIGYVTDRVQIIEAEREAVTDEELQKGAKVYFIKRSYTEEHNGEAVRKTEMIAVPANTQDALKKFIEQLYDSAKSIEPKKVLPEAKERTKAYRRGKLQVKAA